MSRQYVSARAVNKTLIHEIHLARWTVALTARSHEQVSVAPAVNEAENHVSSVLGSQ